MGIFTLASAVFVFSAAGAIHRSLPVWVTIALNAAVTFVMFTVAHEALHSSLSSTRWVNAVVGRLAWVFVVPTGPLPVYRFVHTQHHRYANDQQNDPDMFFTHAPAWQLPFRWALADVFYSVYYAPRLWRRVRRRQHRALAEVAEMAVTLALGGSAIMVPIVNGNLWLLAVIFLIPQRIGFTIIGWWFDWLPHHGLEHTQRDNCYRASRIRVGMEWLLTPLLLSQNYHLLHHLHPWLPFYRYPAVWRCHKQAYVERDIAISTVFGRQLN